MINLTLLGSGGNMPMPNRFLSSVFIQYNGRKILIDCGESTQTSMRINNCGFKTIDLICITHLHGDHFFGLLGLLSTMGNSGKTDYLTIIGPNGIKSAIDSVMSLLEYLPFKLNILESPKGTFSLNNKHLKYLDISTLDLQHSSECIGYSFMFRRNPRFDVNKANKNNVPKVLWQKLQSGNNITYKGLEYFPEMVLGEDRKGIKISFVTDTRPIDTIPSFIYGSDLFICEGMYGDDLDISKAIKNHHMTFREAANLACLGNVKTLLLTHFSPSINDPMAFKENASTIFSNTIIGEDGLEFNFNFK